MTAATLFYVLPSFGASWKEPPKKPAVQSVACDPTAFLNASDITATSATIHWASVPDAIRYYVYYKIAGSGSEYSVQVAGLSYPLTGLKPCQTYEVRLKGELKHITPVYYKYRSYYFPKKVIERRLTHLNARVKYQVLDSFFVIAPMGGREFFWV